jgi:Family of unknown function (DUF6101)
MQAGRITAGPVRVAGPHRPSAMGTIPLRLDPFALPVRFAAADAAADQCLRIVDLHRERVVLRRCVRGMRMALNLPLSAYRGVAIRLVGEKGLPPSAIAVVLEHRDPALSLPLYVAAESDEVLAEWQSWGRVLGLPLLVAADDGALREPFARIGALRIEAAAPRRRRRTMIARRRPRFLLRRRAGSPLAAAPVHRGEREIIARN